MNKISTEQLRIIEEISFNAWTSLQQNFDDGWILRFADGYTKRANSINPIYPGKKNIEEKIHRCQQIYLNKNLKPVFRITPLADDKLDLTLANAGYDKKDVSSVQTLDLLSVEPQSTTSVKIWTELEQEWLDNLVHLAAIPLQNWDALTGILLNIIPQKCFALLEKENQIVACGLGVLERQYIGLFEIVTAQNKQRRGYAKELILNILNWGKQKQATQAYLQVVLNNQPAVNLYAKLGFKESYQYFYRIKEY